MVCGDLGQGRALGTHILTVLFSTFYNLLLGFILLCKKSFREFMYVAINASGGVIMPVLSLLAIVIPAFEILIDKKVELLKGHYQITRSFPPSTGICAPVVLENKGPHNSATNSLTSLLSIWVPKILFFLYSSTVSP